MAHFKAPVAAVGLNMDRFPKVIVWRKDQRRQREFGRICRGCLSSSQALAARAHNCAPEVGAVGYVPGDRASATPAA